jgi:hypothetical protein
VIFVLRTFGHIERAAAFAALVFLLGGCDRGPRGNAIGDSLPSFRQRDSSAQASLSFAIERSHGTNRAPVPGASHGFVPPSTGLVFVKVGGIKTYVSPFIKGKRAFSATFAVPAGRDTIEVDLQADPHDDGNYITVSSATVTQNMPSGATTPLIVDFHGKIASVHLEVPEQTPAVGKTAVLPVRLVATDPAFDPIDAGPLEMPIDVALSPESASGAHMKLVNSEFRSATDVLKVAYDGHLMIAPLYLHIATMPWQLKNKPFLMLANAYTTFKTPWRVTALAMGPNHALWFTECRNSNSPGCDFGTIAPDGTMKRFGQVVGAQGLVEGPDGNMWFAEGERRSHGFHGPTVGKISPAGVVTEYHLHTVPGHSEFGVYNMLAPRDGKNAIWFTEIDRVGKITTDGRVTEYLFDPANHYGPVRSTSFVEGADGRFYFDGALYGIFELDPAGAIVTFRGSFGSPYLAALVPSKDGILFHPPSRLLLLPPKGAARSINSKDTSVLLAVDGVV